MESAMESALRVCAEAGDATATLSTLSVWSYTSVVALLALVPIVLMVRNLRLAVRAKAAKEGQTVLRAGPAVLEGEVDHPTNPPLRVEISQSGTQSHFEGGRVQSHWTEMGRSTKGEPFELKLPSGDRVHVIADDSVQLLLDMEQTEPLGEKARRRIAEVRDGDRIHISGRLEVTTEMDPTAGGYRGGATRQRWVLRPSGAGGMLVSKRSMGEVFRHPIRYYAGALALLAAVLVLVHALFVGFHARTHAGVVVPGEITAKRVVHDPDDNTDFFVIDIRLPQGTSLTANPTNACYERVKEGDRIPVLIAENYPSLWQIGASPSANLAIVFAGFLAVVAGMVAYIFMLRASRRWHGGRLLDE